MGRVENIDGATISVINWNKFNARRDVVQPTWFKMGHNLFSDQKFYDLSGSDWHVFLYLMCEVSKAKTGSMCVNLAHAKRVGQLTEDEITRTLDKLLKSGFIILDQNVRNTNVTSACARAHAQENANVRTSSTLVALRQEEKRRDILSSDDDHVFDFDAAYAAYPKRNGGQRKQEGIEYCKKHFSSADKYERLMLSIKNYKAHCVINSKEGTEFVFQFATFVRKAVDEWAEKTIVAPRLKTLADLDAEESANA